MRENKTPSTPKRRNEVSPMRRYLRTPLVDVTQSAKNRICVNSIDYEPSSPTPPPSKKLKAIRSIDLENIATEKKAKKSRSYDTKLNPPIFENKIRRSHHNNLGPFDILMRREMWGTAQGGSLVADKTWRASTRFMIKDFVSTSRSVYSFYGEFQHVAPFACSFSNVVGDGKYLAVADEEGNISLIDTRFDNMIQTEKPRLRFHAHDNAIFDIQWNLDDKILITASGDQTARLWDVEKQECKAVFHAHTCSVKSVALNQDEPNIWATASRDGNVHIWDDRTTPAQSTGERFYKPVASIRAAHSLAAITTKKSRPSDPNPIRSQPTNSATGVQFLKQDKNLVATSGAVDGVIKYWDLRNHSHRKVNSLPVQTSIDCSAAKRPHGISNLSLDHSGRRIYANSTDNYIYMYDATDLGAPLTRFTHPTYRCSSFYVRLALSPDDRYLVSGSSEKSIYIWEVDEPERPPIILQGHDHEVTSVAWCFNDFDTIASCSDDTTLRIWHRRGYDEE